MAQAHVYARVQVTSTDAAVLKIQEAGKALAQAIEDAGGSCPSVVTVSLDESEPVEPVADETQDDGA